LRSCKGKNQHLSINHYRQQPKMSDIVNHLLDNYLQEAKQDLLHNAENSGKDKTKNT
jgi:hypothetical protein